MLLESTHVLHIDLEFLHRMLFEEQFWKIFVALIVKKCIFLQVSISMGVSLYSAIFIFYQLLFDMVILTESNRFVLLASLEMCNE
jgi:hypothetical protein